MVTEENEVKTTIRLSVPIDKEINDRLASLLPAGLKAQVIRSLVELFIKTQEEMPEDYLAQALIKGHCELRTTKPTNLSKFERSDRKGQ